MLWRVRATLPDRPGALATFAQRCGDADVNILAMQVFPSADDVVDEFVLETPDAWSAAGVANLLSAAGGTRLVVQVATKQALEDQPTRFVQAAREVIERPMAYPEIAAELFDATPEAADSAGIDHILETSIAGVTVQVHRDAPFTETERARGETLAALVNDVLGHRPQVSVANAASSHSVDPEYILDGTTAYAWVAGSVVGSVVILDPVADPDGRLRPVTLQVDAAWQRRGIGTNLLRSAARLAKGLGADEILLTTSSDNAAVLPMVLAAGLRGRIRMAGDQLTVRASVRDMRPLPST